MSDSSLRDYMKDQEVERVAYIVMDNFSKMTGRTLEEDEEEFVLMVTKTTFEKYVVEEKHDIMVAQGESQEKLADLIDQFVGSLSMLIVHYIYSRLEAYILFKQLKELQGQ